METLNEDTEIININIETNTLDMTTTKNEIIKPKSPKNQPKKTYKKRVMNTT